MPAYARVSQSVTAEHVSDAVRDMASPQWHPEEDDLPATRSAGSAFRGMLWQMTANIARNTFDELLDSYARAAEAWQGLVRLDTQSLDWEELLRQAAEAMLQHETLLPPGIREQVRESAQFVLRFVAFYQEQNDVADRGELATLMTRYSDIFPEGGVKAVQDLLFILQHARRVSQGTLPQRLQSVHDMLGSDLLHSLPFAAQLRVNIAAIITASGYWQMAETLWEETQQINASAGSVTEKMQQVAALLLRQQPYLPAEWQEAVGVISAVQRQVAALLAQPEGSESSMLERTQRVLQSLSSLVNSPVVAAWLPGLIREHLDALLNQGRLIVGALNSLLSGGHSLSFEDYLAQVLALGDAIAPELLTPLRTLATQIRHIVAPWQDATFPTWPEPATPAAMLGWLQSVLMHPLFRETVLPRLPEEYRQALTSALHLSQQAGTFPVQGTTHEQLQWLLTQIHNPDLRQLMAQAGLETYLTALREQLSGDAASELFSLFLQLINPNQTVAQRLGNLIAGIFRGSVLTGAVSAGLRWMPGGQVLEPLFRLGMHWYQRTLLAPTWAATLGNFLRVVQEDLSGNVLVMDLVARLTGVMPPSAAEAMRTLQTIHAFQLQRDLTTPDDTLRWVLAGAVHYPELKPWYQNYLNLMLAWSVKKILESRDVRTQQQEVAHLQARLSEPEWQLWPGVAQLSALLPLLPLLPAIREELGERTLPTGNSWLEWSAAVADILAASEHPALQQVRRQLEQNIEAWISDTLLQGMTGDARRRLLTSRRLPERWSMAGISSEGMREEGDIWLSGGEMFIREQGRMYRVEPDAEHGVLRLIKPGETHASGASPRVLREDGRWRLDLRPAAGLPGGSPVAGMDISGGIIRLGQDDMDWLASEETQRVAKVATGVGLGIWWLGTLYAFWRSYHQPAPASYRAAPQEAAPAQPPSHEAAARLLNPPVTETVVEMGEPQNTDTTPGRWQRAAALGRRYRVPLGMTALGAISSAAYLQWLLRNPEQDVLSEEDLTALQAVLAQRDYQIVIDLPQPERHDRVRRAVGRRLLAEESTTPAPEAEEKIWPPLPRSTRVDAALEKAVREAFPPAGKSDGTVADYKMDLLDETIYTLRGLDFLFVADSYRYIDIYSNTPAGITARVYAKPSLLDTDNVSLPVIYKHDTHKWFLDSSQEESPQEGVTTLPPKVKNKAGLTTASSSLIQLAGSWGTGNTFQYIEMATGQEGAIYQDDKFYICLQGKYWPFIFVSDSVGVIITGAKCVYVLRKENTWDTATTIRPMVMPGVSVVSRDIDERIEKEFDPRNAMQPSSGDFKTQKERGIYESASGETFIYAATNFWPVTLTKTTASSTVYDNATIYEKRNDSTAKTVNIFKDRQSQQWGDKDQTPSTGTRKRPKNTTASAWLTEEARLWDYDTRTAGFPASLEGDGGIYRQPNGDLYIFLNKAWWPFVFLGGNVGVISVKKKDETVNVIVHNYKGMWEYAGETAVEAPQVISDAISSLLINTDLAREIRHALFHALSGHDYVSWNTLLQLLLQIIDQEFYRLYTEPDNEKLRKLLILKNKLVRRQQQMHYTEQLLPAAKKNEWNEPLLNTYYHAFSTGLVDTTEIYAAWHSRLVVQDIKKKKKLLESYNVDLKIAEVSRKIAEADNRRQIHMRNIKEQFNAPDGNKEITRAKEEQEKIKILESEKKQLQKIADNIREKTTQYDKQIQLHSEKYSGYDQGVILAKNTLGTNLRHSTDQNSTSLATEEAIITLALQEVKMLVKEREAYSEKELHELKTIRIARDLVIRMSEQQSIFNSLVNRLTAIGIEKHSLANDYTDIVWVNEQAEKINKNNFQFNENTEDSFFLAPILYWLLKNNKKISNLQGQDITQIVDDYYTDVYHLNPLTEITKIPEGYTSLSGVLSSEYFENQSDYNEQFRVYKEKYSTYDASELAKTLLLFSGVSLADLLKKTKKRLRFEVKVTDTDANRMPGEMLFIQLHDNRWIFFSLFPGAMFSRVFSANQMNANVFLNEITKINPDAKFSFDEYLELYSNTFLKQHGGMGIGLFRERWEIIKKNLIKAFLYNSDNGIEYPSPFSENSDYGIIYHRNINATQPGNNVISLLNTSIRAVLNNSAEVKRRELYTPSILQKIAFVMIPFYREIYHYATNEEYEVDMESVLLDTIGVVFIAVSAGVQIASVISRMKGISTFLQQGLKNGLAGKSLQLYVLKEMVKDAAFSALKITKISMMALIDMIDPLAIKEITRFTIHRISKTKNLRVLVPEDVPIAQTRGINKKYARTDVDIWKMYKSKVKDAEVYVPSTINNQNKEYYISVDDNTYQIRWDDASYTWRTVDPKNPGRFAYGEPIVFENGKWKINIAYGGLRGGGKRASSRDDVVMGIQQMREDLKKEKVLENLNGGNEFDAQEYLTKMREVGEISQSINYPKEKCEYVSSYVAAYLARNGFEEIRYRAMAFFIHGTDRKPVNHYVIVARRGEKGGDYVFDITAAQFGGIYAELNGPIILPEALWAQKYANLTSRSLIKYGDYPTRAAATTDFGPFSKYFFYGPNSLIPNAKVLLRPSWYYPATQVADTVAGTQKKMPVIGLGFSNPVREAARRSRLTDVVSDVSWDYAVDLLENAELLSRGPGDALRKGLKQATGEPEFVNVKSLFARTQTVDSMESLLRVRQGDVLLFTATDPALSAMEARPVHIMVSLGNGRFAGVKNNVLDPALGEGKQIITAEQLGEFTGTTFRRRGGDTRDIHLIAAEPKEIIREESLTLKTLAEQATETVADAQAVLTKSTDLLRQSGELAPEQALALQAILTPLFKSGTQQAGTEINRSVKQFFVTPQKVPNSTALGALPKGKLVIFGDSGADSFSAHHLMYSLGEGEFMMVNPARLDPRLTSNNAVVKASQFPEELFSKYGVQAGDISLTNLRLTSLLGRDARFFADGPILTVRLHGAASNVNYMDAYELSEVIKGLALRETPPLNLGSIREIKLESCYGAFGLVPTGKALAYLLDKKVVAYPLRFSARIHNNPSVFNRFRTYVPADLSPAERTKIINQSSRNHDFWNRLLGLYKSVKTTRTRREADLFTDLINNVADFVNGVFDERVFLDEYPEYQSGLYVTLEQFRALCSDEINSAEAFAERCMDILTLSAFSADLLDKYLGGTGSVS
ncbi:hypothetical protein [Kosakonia sp. WA-90]|uniref:hypothetical protein n=1 Tax=Kosakonia sp. WA-90 TaxID=3153576 RepID=UPI00325F219F